MLEFENLTSMNAEISSSTGSSRRVCFSCDQNVKNIFKLANFVVNDRRKEICGN